MLADHHLDEGLDFHLPGEYNVLVPLKYENERLLHRQLVCWCCIQRYWYYVLHNPQVSDEEYDQIESAVKELEEDCGYLKDSNWYSPLDRAGSSRKEDYPKFVRAIFAGC